MLLKNYWPSVYSSSQMISITDVREERGGERQRMCVDLHISIHTHTHAYTYVFILKSTVSLISFYFIKYFLPQFY